MAALPTQVEPEGHPPVQEGAATAMPPSEDLSMVYGDGLLLLLLLGADTGGDGFDSCIIGIPTMAVLSLRTMGSSSIIIVMLVLSSSVES